MTGLQISQILPPANCQSAGGDACHPQENLNFKNADSALSHVFSSNSQLQVLAFGYTHKETPFQRSAIEKFANEMVPLLAGQEYHDLVLEIFPHGNPSDAIEIEISEFNRTGVIGPEMNRFMGVLDKPSFELLLNQARKYGMAIHSGGVDYQNVNQTILHPNFVNEPWRVQMARHEIAQNTKRRIKALVRGERNVASLNGCSHNDLYPSAANLSANFGRYLNNLFPGRVAEIDLVIPELSERNNYFKDLALSPKCFWKSFIPKQGVNLVSELGKNSYLLFWPAP